MHPITKILIFFDRINNQSRVLIAVDPLFQKSLPQVLSATELADSDSRPAFVNLKAGGADVVHVEAASLRLDGAHRP